MNAIPVKDKSRYTTVMPTPLGQLIIEADEHALTRVEFLAENSDADAPGNAQSNALVLAAKAQLEAYFAGELKTFDLPLAPKGTEFRGKVWTQLLNIPYGETACYGDIAHAMDNPKAVRAVGAANGANPIAIIIPCHRIIGKDGSLTGYAGGLDRKEWLLAFERG